MKQTEDDIEQMQAEMDPEAAVQTEMDAALPEPEDGTNAIDGQQGPPVE